MVVATQLVLFIVAVGVLSVVRRKRHSKGASESIQDSVGHVGLGITGLIGCLQMWRLLAAEVEEISAAHPSGVQLNDLPLLTTVSVLTASIMLFERAREIVGLKQ